MGIEDLQQLGFFDDSNVDAFLSQFLNFPHLRRPGTLTDNDDVGLTGDGRIDVGSIAPKKHGQQNDT